MFTTQTTTKHVSRTTVIHQRGTRRYPVIIRGIYKIREGFIETQTQSFQGVESEIGQTVGIQECSESGDQQPDCLLTEKIAIHGDRDWNVPRVDKKLQQTDQRIDASDQED